MPCRRSRRGTQFEKYDLQVHSLLYRLPAQVRLAIWRECFRGYEIDIKTPSRPWEAYLTNIDDARPLFRTPRSLGPMIRVCKRVYNEVKELMYGEILFVIPQATGLGSPPPGFFRGNASHQIRLIRRVALTFEEDVALDRSSHSPRMFDSLKSLLSAFEVPLNLLVLKVVLMESFEQGESKERDEHEDAIRIVITDQGIADLAKSLTLIFQYTSPRYGTHRGDQKAWHVLPSNCTVERRWSTPDPSLCSFSLIRQNGPWRPYSSMVREGPSGEQHFDSFIDDYSTLGQQEYSIPWQSAYTTWRRDLPLISRAQTENSLAQY